MSRAEQLLAKCLAADGRAQESAAVRAVAAAGLPPRPMRWLLVRLLRAAPGGPRLAAGVVAAGAGPLDAGLFPVAARLVGDRELPLNWRLAVAGRWLDALPDLPPEVAAVTRRLTAGEGRFGRVELLHQLQRYCEKCAALDRAVGALDAALVARCPKCDMQLGRATLVAHLWVRHKCELRGGALREPAELLEPVLARAAGGDGAAVRAAFQETSALYPGTRPEQVVQSLVARGHANPEALAHLARLADEGRCGLCPICLAAVPDALPELPPPANRSPGRVGAEGYAVSVSDGTTGRSVLVERPRREPERSRRERYSAQMTATALALPVVGAAFGLALFLPGGWALPGTAAALLMAGLVYAVAVSRETGWPKPDAEAMSAAWELVRLARPSAGMARYAARLARLSLSDRTVSAREAVLAEFAAPGASAELPPELSAALAVLAARDRARQGHEPVVAVAALFAPAARLEMPLAEVEVAAALVNRDWPMPAGERRRLAVLVWAEFAAEGWTPADAALVGRFAPELARLWPDASGGGGGHRAALAALDALRLPAGAVSVTDFAAGRPEEASRRLAAAPDTLADLPRLTALLGHEAAVTSGGFALGGERFPDPSAQVAAFGTPAGPVLRVGGRRFGLPRDLSAAEVELVRGWLGYYAGVVRPVAEELASRPVRPQIAALLKPLAVVCPLCSAVQIAGRGQVGTLWDAVRAATGR